MNLVKSKINAKEKKVEFNEKLLKKHLGFLNFVVFEASEYQLASIIYEIEPEQLEAIRNLVKNLIKQNNKLALEYYLKKDSPFSDVRVKGVNSTRKKISHADLKKVEALKNFIQKLITEKASRPMLRNRASFLKFLMVKGLNLYRSTVLNKKNLSLKQSENVREKQEHKANDDEKIEKSKKKNKI